MRKIHILPLLLFLFACGGGAHEGFVGESITIKAENPEEGMDVDFEWTLTNQPDGSLINSNDLFASEDGQKMTFVPDYPGDYAIDVILTQYGDELSSQSFSFEILDEVEQSEEIESDDEIVESDEDWLNEDFSEEDNTDPYLADSEDSEEEEYEEYDDVDQDYDEEDVDVDYEEEDEEYEDDEVVISTPIQKKKFNSIPEKTDRYTIQITSKRHLKEAQTFTNQLIQKGLDAYIQKVLFEGNEIWYRVRIGSYDTYNSAKVAANQLAKDLEMATWVDFVRKDQ